MRKERSLSRHCGRFNGESYWIGDNALVSQRTKDPFTPDSFNPVGWSCKGVTGYLSHPLILWRSVWEVVIRTKKGLSFFKTCTYTTHTGNRIKASTLQHMKSNLSGLRSSFSSINTLITHGGGVLLALPPRIICNYAKKVLSPRTEQSNFFMQMAEFPRWPRADYRADDEWRRGTSGSPRATASTKKKKKKNDRLSGRSVLAARVP